MKVFKLILVVSFGIACLVTLGLGLDHDHSNTVDDIRSVLNSIEERIYAQIGSQNETLHQMFGALDNQVTALKDKVKTEEHKKAEKLSKELEAELEFLDAKQEVSVAENKVQLAQENVDERKQEVQQEKQELSTEFEKRVAHLQAEMRLINRMRSMLSSLLSRDFKSLGQKCDEHYTCSEGLVCEEDSNTCLLPLGNSIQCQHSDECKGDLVCSSDGRCAIDNYSSTECNANQECHEGSVCANNECIPLSCMYVKQSKPDAQSGMYKLAVPVGHQQEQVQEMFCEMQYQGGGWTLFANVRRDGSPYPGKQNRGSDPQSLGYSRNIHGIQFSEIAVFHNRFKDQSEAGKALFKLAQPKAVWDSSLDQIDFQLENGRYCLFSVANSPYQGNHPAAVCNTKTTYGCNEDRSETYGVVSNGTGSCIDISEGTSQTCGGWGNEPYKGDASFSQYGGQFFVR